MDVNKTKNGNKLLNSMKPWLSSLSQSAKKNDADRIITSCMTVIKIFFLKLIIIFSIPNLTEPQKKNKNSQ